MFRLITAGDRKVMRRVNQWTPPLWMRRWMVGASRAGDGWGWCVFGLGVALWGGAERWRALAGGFLSVGVGQAVFNVLKRVTGRARPCATESSCWATLLPPDRFSFPSGHTITAFAVAVPMGLFYPALLPVLLFCAVSVASSRVLLGLHYLSDVLAGIAIGCALGMGGFWAAAQISL
jgi:undecaprenyl-diphosphatase